MPNRTLRKFLPPMLLLFILALAAVLRIYHLSFKSISIDEAIGGFYAMEPLLRVIILTINDVHPPLFYVIHHFWIALFGMSEVALRSISVLFALLSVIGLYKLGKLIFNRRVGLIAAFLLAISPWHIWISQNARSNSLLLFLIIVSIYSFFQLLETKRKKWFAVYACVTTIAIYTHYFAFMIWIAQNLYVILSAYARRRIFFNWWQAQIVILACYLFWLPLMISQFITKTRPMYKDLSFKFVKNLFDFLNPYASAQQSWFNWLGEEMFFLLLLLGIYRLYKENGKEATSQLGNGSARPLISNRILGALLFVVPVLTLLAGWYFKIARSLPMLQTHISRNDPIIYADAVKPYHIEQLNSLPLSFYLGGIIGLAILLILMYTESLSKKAFSLLSTVGSTISKRKMANNFHFSKLEFLLVHLLLPVIFAGLVSLKSPYLLLRNMVIAIPPYFLLVSVAISSVKRLWPRLALFAAAIVLSGYSLLHFEKWNVKDDWRSAAKVAKENVQPGDMILLDHLFGKKPFYYYGLQTVKPLKRTEAESFLEKAPQDVWLLVSYQSKWSVRDLLDKHFEKVEEWSFPGSTNVDDLPTIDGEIHLIHYRKKSANSTAGTQREESVPDKSITEGKKGISSGPTHHKPLANATSGEEQISH